MPGSHPTVLKGRVSPGVELDDEGDSDLEMSFGEISKSDIAPEELKQVAAEGLAILHETKNFDQSADEAAIKFSEVENKLFANFSTVIKRIDDQIWPLQQQLAPLQQQLAPLQQQLDELTRKKKVFTDMEARLRTTVTNRHLSKGGSRRRRITKRRKVKRGKTVKRKRRRSKNSLY